MATDQGSSVWSARVSRSTHELGLETKRLEKCARHVAE